MQGRVEPATYVLVRDLLNREIDISILEMSEPRRLAQGVKKLDDGAIVHDRELARVRKQQFRQDLQEGSEILVDLLLM
jgi:hypothetical protein